MAITFNTNLAALGTQRSLGIAASKTQSSLAKLSSGSRVPTAKDDAAGLAVGTQLKAEVAGLNQASLNASQAISVLQIADGALSTISDILTRMKSLAVQASSGQLSDSDRGLLNNEFVNLRTEVDRIANITSFNGTTLLNGGQTTVATTDGRSGSLASLGIEGIFDTSLTNSADAFRVVYDYTDATTNANGTDESDVGNLTLYNLTQGTSATVNIAALIRAKTGEAADTTGEGVNGDAILSTNLSGSDTVDVSFGPAGVTLRLNKNFNVSSDINVDATGEYVHIDTALSSSSLGTAAGAITASNFYTNGTTGIHTALSAAGVYGLDGVDNNDSLEELAAGTYNRITGLLTLVSNETEVTGGTNNDTVVLDDAGNELEYSLDGGAFGANTGTITLSADHTVAVRLAGGTQTLFQFTIDFDAADTAITATNSAATLRFQIGEGLFGATETVATDSSFDFKVGTGTSANDSISFTLDAATTTALGISSSTISNTSNASSAITALTAAISSVSSVRAGVGASQSRLDFAKASVDVTIQNTTAAQSGLLDVDVSAEITAFTSQQVLLQAGVSLLAQANQQPALLLRLLQ